MNGVLMPVCDKYHKVHKDAYDWFEIEFDHFGRTSTEQQTVWVDYAQWMRSHVGLIYASCSICQDIFLKLHKNGHLQEQVMTQLYCEKDQRCVYGLSNCKGRLRLTYCVSSASSLTASLKGHVRNAGTTTREGTNATAARTRSTPWS